ncbi:hypothetical protein J6590_104207, partial [Homalodisca vitripennis]
MTSSVRATINVHKCPDFNSVRAPRVANTRSFLHPCPSTLTYICIAPVGPGLAAPGLLIDDHQARGGGGGGDDWQKHNTPHVTYQHRTMNHIIENILISEKTPRTNNSRVGAFEMQVISEGLTIQSLSRKPQRQFHNHRRFLQILNPTVDRKSVKRRLKTRIITGKHNNPLYEQKVDACVIRQWSTSIRGINSRQLSGNENLRNPGHLAVVAYRCRGSAVNGIRSTEVSVR